MAQHYNPRITDVSSLIFYLDVANTKSYPGTGSSWYDISGNNNHFTLYNTPTYTQNGTTGTYFTFNGTNQYARSTNAINWNNYSAITLEIGYRSTSTATQVLYETTGTGGSTVTGGISLVMNANNTTTLSNVYYSNWWSYGSRVFGYTPTTNTTFNSIIDQYVNGVDSTGRQTYINGSPATYFTNTSVISTGTTTTSGLSFANTWTYIASRDGTASFFKGDVAFVRAWGTKVSSNNLQNNFSMQAARSSASYLSPTIFINDPTVVVPVVIPNNPTPVLLGSSSAIGSSAASCTISSYTVPNGSVIILVSATEFPGVNITSISGTLGLTWTKRSQIGPMANGNAGATQMTEVWWAANTSGISKTGSIAASYSGTFDDQGMVVAHFSGCNTTNPWPTLSAYTATTGVSVSPSITMSTDRSNAFGLVIMSSGYANSLATPTGWTLLNSAINGGASYWEYLYVYYNSWSGSQQSNLVVSSSSVPIQSSTLLLADSLVG